MISNIRGPQRKGTQAVTFTAKDDAALKLAKKFLSHQENVADNRFIQDTATNWAPKAIFARSGADFADMSFLEFIESGIFYFLPTIFGNFFKKNYSKFHSAGAKEAINKNIARSASDILNDKELQKDGIGKKVLSTKAAIILACTAIPAAEYALSFAKNLFTLKVFKKSDFNNIANLNKEKVEDKEQQDLVEKSAKKHIKKAGLLSIGGLGASLVFAKYGHKSEALQKASSLILQPGAHIANGLKKINWIKQDGGFEKFLKKYITPDFAGVNEKGKFQLSEGQLLVTTVSGFFGYSAAAKDRGKLDQYEVWTRVPFVVLFTVFGSALFDKAFNQIFIKHNIFPDIIKKDPNAPTGAKAAIKIEDTKDLPALAEKLAKEKKTLVADELSKLTKQKAIIKGIPFAFSIVFMGFFLSGITRFWTQYRYNHGKGQKKPNEQTVEPSKTAEQETFNNYIKSQSKNILAK